MEKQAERERDGDGNALKTCPWGKVGGIQVVQRREKEMFHNNEKGDGLR